MTWEAARNAAGSGAAPAGTFARKDGPQFIEGKPTGAQDRSRPEHRKRRASTAPSTSRNRHRKQRTVAGELHRPSAGKPYPSAWKVMWALLSRRRHVYAAKHLPTRHYLKTTSDNRLMYVGGEPRARSRRRSRSGCSVPAVRGACCAGLAEPGARSTAWRASALWAGDRREGFNPGCGSGQITGSAEMQYSAFRPGSARAPPGVEDDQGRRPVPPGRREDRAAGRIGGFQRGVVTPFRRSRRCTGR